MSEKLLELAVDCELAAWREVEAILGTLVDTVTANQAMRKAADLLISQSQSIRVMREALERARPHVVNASVGVVPPESEACAMDDLREIDSALGASGHD